MQRILSPPAAATKPLLARIRRIVGLRTERSRLSGWIVGAILFLVIAGTSGSQKLIGGHGPEVGPSTIFEAITPIEYTQKSLTKIYFLDSIAELFETDTFMNYLSLLLEKDAELKQEIDEGNLFMILFDKKNGFLMTGSERAHQRTQKILNDLKQAVNIPQQGPERERRAEQPVESVKTQPTEKPGADVSVTLEECDANVVCRVYTVRDLIEDSDDFQKIFALQQRIMDAATVGNWQMPGRSVIVEKNLSFSVATTVENHLLIANWIFEQRVEKRNQLYVKTYDVDKIPFLDNDAHNEALIDFIKKVIEPNSWQEPAKIECDAKQKTLTICQTKSIHEKVTDVLKQLTESIEKTDAIGAILDKMLGVKLEWISLDDYKKRFPRLMKFIPDNFKKHRPNCSGTLGFLHFAEVRSGSYFAKQGVMEGSPLLKSTTGNQPLKTSSLGELWYGLFQEKQPWKDEIPMTFQCVINNEEIAEIQVPWCEVKWEYFRTDENLMSEYLPERDNLFRDKVKIWHCTGLEVESVSLNQGKMQELSCDAEGGLKVTGIVLNHPFTQMTEIQAGDILYGAVIGKEDDKQFSIVSKRNFVYILDRLGQSIDEGTKNIEFLILRDNQHRVVDISLADFMTRCSHVLKTNQLISKVYYVGDFFSVANGRNEYRQVMPEKDFETLCHVAKMAMDFEEKRDFIQFYQNNSSLIINTTEAKHEKIIQLFELFRKIDQARFGREIENGY